VVLRGIGDSGTRGIGDLDAGICQAPDLGGADQQQDKYREDKGELDKGLSFVFL
jgi:hypothetical protein